MGSEECGGAVVSKHTPGPWRIWDNPMAWNVVIWAGEKQVGIATGNIEVSREQAIANAHLMAAAPDLLGACMAAMAYLVDPPSGFKENREAAADIIRNAIKKAEGR